MAVVLLVSRCVIVAVFLRAGLAKIVDLADFRSAVLNYRLLPSALVPAVAFGLPFAEVAAAVLLAAGILPGPVAALLAVLLVAFAAAIAVNLAHGRVFDCGCAGAAPQTISWKHVASDAVLAGLAVMIALAPPRTLAVWPGPAGPFSVATPRADAVPLVLACVMGLAVVTVLRRAAAVSSAAKTFTRQPSAERVRSDSGR